VRSFRWPALILSFIMSGMPAAFASTTVHQLGLAPLLGVSSTTAEVREKVRTHPRLMRRAAEAIGLSPREYAAFYRKFMNQRPGWVTIPRHLDAMSWSAEGVVHSEYDIIIPQGVNGWEVDLYEKHQIAHIYLPMICGNLSVVRTPRKEVAVLPPPPPLPLRRVFAPVPPPVQPVVPAPVPLTALSQEIPPVSSPVVHHHPRLFWPIFGTVVLAAVLLTHSHHGNTPNSVVTPHPIQPPPPDQPPSPPCGCDTPPPPPPCGCTGENHGHNNGNWATMGRYHSALSISL
jgi:hypothetical protein